jgi:hypothetical protein
MMIKKLFFLFTGLFLLTTACGTTTGEQTNNSEELKVEDTSGKPEYLTYETFVDKVWNFEEIFMLIGALLVGRLLLSWKNWLKNMKGKYTYIKLM